jgi:tetratricopeptide (TPR) repeat protein
MRERARKELARPAKLTLESLLELDQEARALGFVSERVEILLMLSQTYWRLGDEAEAERTAGECVETAEGHGDLMLLAQALNRLAATQLQNAPARAEENYRQALSIAEQIGDARTQARCHINLATIAARRNDWEAARHSYGRGIVLARGAGMPDLWGTSALNLGVGCYRTGDYDRARELLGEALALVAAVKNSEIQLRRSAYAGSRVARSTKHGKPTLTSRSALIDAQTGFRAESSSRHSEWHCSLPMVGRKKPSRGTKRPWSPPSRLISIRPRG